MKQAVVKQFKLNGKPLVIDAGLRIAQFLDKQPDDELFTTGQIRDAVGASSASQVRHLVASPRLEGYSVTMGANLRYWGNKRAIEEFRKRLAE